MGETPCSSSCSGVAALTQQLYWCSCSYPAAVLCVAPVEVQHPVPQGLQGVGCQLPPDVRDVSVEEGAGHLVQLAAHAHLAGQRLQDAAVRLTDDDTHTLYITTRVEISQGLKSR